MKGSQRITTNINIYFIKAFVCIFYQIFIFSANDSPSKTVKNVYFI